MSSDTESVSDTQHITVVCCTRPQNLAGVSRIQLLVVESHIDAVTARRWHLDAVVALRTQLVEIVTLRLLIVGGVPETIRQNREVLGILEAMSYRDDPGCRVGLCHPTSGRIVFEALAVVEYSVVRSFFWVSC